MRVLIFHGYLLRGTGSNVYNAELGRAFARAGHELHLLCQDRSPLDLPWVDAAGDWDGGALALTVRRDPPRATVYRPDIGGLLPVYVADRYEGVEARPFEDLSEAEVDEYVDPQRRGGARGRRPGAPGRGAGEPPRDGAADPRAGAGRHGVPYAVKIHGSALEYTVKRASALPARPPARAWRARAACSSARATPRRASGRRWRSRAWRSGRAWGRPAST